MLKIKGVNIFPSQIESILMAIPDVAPHYQIVLRTENYADNMELKVEFADAALLDSYQELERLQELIRHRLRVNIGVEIKVTLVAPKSLERFMGKAKRVEDLRVK